MVAGTDVPLWGMEIDPDESTKRFRASSAADKGQVRHVGHSHVHSACDTALQADIQHLL